MEKSPISFPVDRLPPFPLGEIGQAVISLRAQGREVIDLAQLNPSVPPPGGAVERLVQASLLPHNHKYSSSQGIRRLREAMCEWYGRRFGVEICVDSEVAVTLGTKQGLSHLLYATLTHGDTVLVPTPCYPIHSAAVVLAGARCSMVTLPRTEGLHRSELTEHDDEFFASLIHSYQTTWPRPVVMIMSFPHNPTSAVATMGFMERLVATAEELGLYLVHDFAYADLAFDNLSTPSVLQVKGAKDRCVELYSLSKGLNMPGWRVGLCAGNPHLVAALKKIKSYLDCGVFQPLQIAAIHAFEQYETVIAETRDLYQSRRRVVLNGLSELGWERYQSAGSLFSWLRIPEPSRAGGSLKFCRQVLDLTGVALCPGLGFDPGADDCVRIAFSEPEERIREAFGALKRGLKAQGADSTTAAARSGANTPSAPSAIPVRRPESFAPELTIPSDAEAKRIPG